MIAPETLAAALRVAQHGARTAMLAARDLPPLHEAAAAAQPQPAADAPAVQAAPARPEHDDAH